MLRAVDFFCGAGGLTRGFLDVGIDVLCGVDNHRPCKETYESAKNNLRSNDKPVPFHHADIDELSLADLEQGYGVQQDDDQLVFAGCSPCQYWSKINTSRSKSEATKSLLRAFQRLVETALPGYVVVENVPGLLARQSEAGLDTFLGSLESRGYSWGMDIVDTHKYGVPQKRRRFLLVATRLPLAIELPTPSELSSDSPFEGVRVRDHIGPSNGFPRIEAGHRDTSTLRHAACALSDKNLRRIKRTPHDGGDRHAWKDDPVLQLDAYKDKDNYFRDVYGRMKWDEPAPTITTRFISLSNGRFGHPEEDRALSVREGATLQTFPKSYAFHGNLAEVARQIGNAVPPLLARAIGTHLINHYTSSRVSLCA